jgi:hypothetical protein
MQSTQSRRMYNNNSSISATATKRTRQEQWGTWIGNSWIPPQGWKSYSKKEMQAIYTNMTILWIGDSTGRRAATTLFGILQETTSDHVSVSNIDSSKVIDINKSNEREEFCPKWVNHPYHPNLCRKMPQSSSSSSSPDHEFLYVSINCLKNITDFVNTELMANQTITQNVDLIIVSQGIWEVVRPGWCKVSDKNSSQLQEEGIRSLTQLQTPIIWRTSGYFYKGGGNGLGVETRKNETTSLNHEAMDLIDQVADPNLSYVDWGGAIFPRCFGSERIPGDIGVHHGLEPRHVLLQMITNHLLEPRSQ